MRRFFESTGSVSRVTIESQALKSNMLGDPWVRVVDVYVPAGHDGEGLPRLVDLVGFTGSVERLRVSTKPGQSHSFGQPNHARCAINARIHRSLWSGQRSRS